MRRATWFDFGGFVGEAISIHALHEESDLNPECELGTAPISIHALHEESDAPVHVITKVFLIISIHALHEESDMSVTPCLLTS